MIPTLYDSDQLARIFLIASREHTRNIDQAEQIASYARLQSSAHLDAEGSSSVILARTAVNCLLMHDFTMKFLFLYSRKVPVRQFLPKPLSLVSRTFEVGTNSPLRDAVF